MLVQVAAAEPGFRKARLVARAPAKINLCLHVLGRRDDGYHELSSLVAFAAGHADLLTLMPGDTLAITVEGPTAAQSGASDDNLVLQAARHLLNLSPGLVTGHFHLEKGLPVAAGLGGGSSDAAAALRLIAAINGLPADDPVLFEAARRTGADVPVCVLGKPCIMRGIGHELGAPLALPPLPAILVNCGKPVATAPVFKALGLAAGERSRGASHSVSGVRNTDLSALMESLAALRNDLEAPAIAVEPAIAATLFAMAALDGVRLVRMSGSGATCFGLFDTGEAARQAAASLARAEPEWWIVATTLGSIDARTESITLA